MDADEIAVLTYLRGAGGEYIAEREILRRADGKRRYEENPHWAVYVFARLIEQGAIESDGCGHYRITKVEKAVAPAEPENKKSGPQWISPQIRAILERSGKEFKLPEDTQKKKDA